MNIKAVRELVAKGLVETVHIVFDDSNGHDCMLRFSLVDDCWWFFVETFRDHVKVYKSLDSAVRDSARIGFPNVIIEMENYCFFTPITDEEKIIHSDDSGL